MKTRKDRAFPPTHKATAGQAPPRTPLRGLRVYVICIIIGASYLFPSRASGMLRNMYQRDYYAYLGMDQGNYDEKTEQQLNTVRVLSIKLIGQYQGYCDSVIERIKQIVEEEVMEYLLYIELTRYRNEASEGSSELIKELEKSFYDVVVYSDRLNDPVLSEPFLRDFKEKIMDVLWQTDRKIKLMFGEHNVTCALFFFK